MPENTTRFAYLLNRMGVRAADLSASTGIDKTLISRWKNGQRQLSVGTWYMDSLVAFFLQHKKAADLIERTLRAYGLDESTGTLEDNLSFWLSERGGPGLSLYNAHPENKAGQYTANFGVFLGNEGLRNAVITAIDYIISLQKPADVVAVVRGNYQWVTGDETFLHLLVQRLGVAFEKGITLTVISRDAFRAEDIALFSGPWLEAHLKGYIRSYYFDEADSHSDERIVAAVSGAVALRMHVDKSVPDDLYIAMYTDEVTVRQISNICQKYQEIGKPQFQYDFLSSMDGFLKGLSERAVLRSPTYVISQLPSLGTINYAQAHMHARVTQKESIEKISPMPMLFVTPDMFTGQTPVRHIFCLEAVERVFQPGWHIHSAFSSMHKRRIHYSRKLLREQLLAIRAWLLEYSHYEAIFVPQRIFSRVHVNMVSAQGQYTVAWLEDGGNSTCVREKVKTAALFGYAQHVWNSIPEVHKNRTRSIRQIDQWLELDASQEE